MTPNPEATSIVRYVPIERLASGGHASVWLGAELHSSGLARMVAIKRIHDVWSGDPGFVRALEQEARLGSRISHPNVVRAIDFLAQPSVMLVMEYVHGLPISALMERCRELGVRVPVPIASAIAWQALAGMAAIHESTHDDGTPLGLVHRDISPQNLILAVDGTTRVADLGIAIAEGSSNGTRRGIVKGKVSYLAPEQLLGKKATARSDIFSLFVVYWELLTGRLLFTPVEDSLERTPGAAPAPSDCADSIPSSINRLVLRGLGETPSDRFESARAAMAALELATPIASTRAVGDWMQDIAGTRWAERCELLTRATAAMTTLEPTRLVSSPTGVKRRSWGLVALAAGLGVLALTLGIRPWQGPSHDKSSELGLGDAAAGVSLQHASDAVPPSILASGALDAQAPQEQRPQGSPLAGSIRLPVVSPLPSISSTKEKNRAGPPIDCDPPHYVDDAGVRRFKRECMR